MDLEFFVGLFLKLLDGVANSIKLYSLSVGVQFVTIFQHGDRQPFSNLRGFAKRGIISC